MTCFHMVMATKMPSSVYSANAELPAPSCCGSRSLTWALVDCIHKTAFGFRKGLHSQLHLFHAAQPSFANNSKKLAWSIRSSADGSRLDPSPTNNINGGTRLNRAIQAFRIKLLARIKELRRGLPMKLLFFLVGFYCATAFATVIGQTGDWDILSAALAVAIVEGIGALMYKASLPLFGKARRLVTMFNYWKAGLSMGLFLDSFKYEMDNIIGLNNPIDFEIDLFPIFL
ncbi:uncharacterized protein LOC132276510 [Cornus florida]|uniref:uncharacterized protein LOC132276510 n=1 Tax=Cornus florida TaxID=4283 RepID=UPI00289D9FC7|nr:uncharacterized protein LOC132276510 [Cornus florida]